MEGIGELYVLTVAKCFCKRETKRVRLARERALALLHSAPVMHHVRMFTIR
jgi:hypothetical protein